MLKVIGFSLLMFVILGFLAEQAGATGFVNLPQDGTAESAYIRCNSTGDFGSGVSAQPMVDANNNCAVFLRNAMRAPISGYELKAMKMRIVTMPAPNAGADDNVGNVTDMVWRNADDTDCIYGTFIHMNDTLLANGKSWEVNDVARGGFAGKSVDVAYLFAFHPKGVRSTEAVFRIGRTFTSVRHVLGDADLPSKSGKVSASTAISSEQTAMASSNWVDFTTDLNWHDPDGSSFPDSSFMYIKTACTADAPIEVEGAIRLRTTGQNGQEPFELSVQGFAPIGTNLNLY